MLGRLTVRVQRIAPTREVAWLRWENHHGQIGWGEIAPLPGRSRETLQQAVAQVQAETNRILSVAASSFQECIQERHWFSSVAFALESAFLQMYDPWIQPFCVATSALLMGTKKEIEKQIPAIEGASILKLKLAQLSLQEARDLIETLSPHYLLRMDPNRTWSQAEILALAETTPAHCIQYFEEPFCSWEDDRSSFPYPIAIDESCTEEHLHNPSLLDPFLVKGVRWIVYKPSLLGGLSRGSRMLDWAKRNGVKVVLGSSFESSLGIACIGDLARRLKSKEVQGLGTLPFVSPCGKEGLRYFPPFIHLDWAAFLNAMPVELIHSI